MPAPAKTAPIPEAPPAPVAPPEPLGAHHNPGNADARAAFIDEMGDGGAPPPPPSEDAAPGESQSSESVPAMSIEMIAAMATGMIDTTGQLVGNKLVKRPDIQWALETAEKENVQTALVPVLNEALKDVKVTPLHALVAVLLSCYAPRALMVAASQQQQQQAPAPSQTEVPPPPPIEKEVNAPPAPASPRKNYGWS